MDSYNSDFTCSALLPREKARELIAFLSAHVSVRCDNCRHWKLGGDNAEWEAERAGMGECLAIRERWRIADEASGGLERCYSDGESNPWLVARANALRAAKAYVQDGSEYRAELFTAPDFFCALHSPAAD